MADIAPTGEAKKTVIGKIVPTPRENNLTSYAVLDIIVKDGRAYLSKTNDNKAAVTDTSKWLKITENTYDIAVRLGLYKGSETDFVGAVTAAKNAASNATAAAQEARQATQQVLQLADNGEQLLEQASQKIKQLEQVIKDGQLQADSMRALEENITNYVQSAPTRMELEYNEVLTLGNPAAQRITAKLYPAYVLQNVLFLPAGEDDVVTVDPDGLLHIHKAGKAKIHVIPTHNVILYRTIEIEVKEPVLRKSGDGSPRLNSDGTIRLT